MNWIARVGFLLLTSQVPGLAQLAPPPGWTSQQLQGGVVMFSPGADASSRVALTLLPLALEHNPTKQWFADQTVALAQGMGHPLGATEVMEEEGILVRMVQIENATKLKLRTLFYGYRALHGFQMAVLMIPPKVGDEDPRLETANTYVQGLAAKKFEFAPAPGPSMPPSQPGPAGGADSNTGIDLTYHPKAVLPKDHDVPLKGVYVFIGFAFGPSYGGVGTTMTWGQKPTQQLLLLFANGVAAKVDLKGGNLAGKYEAEGFATMDVSNPAAVSSAPFGHWSEDGGTMRIRWNIGSPSELVKSGPNLEAKGERWTPYQLADGIQLEGTFVRQMEAGLRSQWITLHKDGTFIGDGVNVTMGGTEVNPAFPERGSGTYEIRKGSMILYFGNGFTQAIACVVDPPNANAKTVLLNEFPFQRER